jgi:hypothetical protein
MGMFAQHSLITFYPLPTKENKLLFSVFVSNKQMEVCRFRLQQTNKSCHFLLVPFSFAEFQKR